MRFSIHSIVLKSKHMYSAYMQLRYSFIIMQPEASWLPRHKQAGTKHFYAEGLKWHRE